jgi:hypothetical protein
MTRRASILLGLLLLGGCVYDPYTGGYYPCCSYPAYPRAPYYPYPYPPPQYGYPPPPGYPQGQPAPAARRGGGGQALVQRFDAANVTHDGRLTLQQAQAARWPEVVRNFPAMDIGQKGYVTLDDIRIWQAENKRKPPGRG